MCSSVTPTAPALNVYAAPAIGSEQLDDQLEGAAGRVRCSLSPMNHAFELR